MDGEKLVRMANQIGTFFAGQAKAKRDDEIAVAGIADHIQKFWDPRMRRGLADYLASGSRTPLDPLVRRAFERIPVPALAPAAVDVPQPIDRPEEPAAASDRLEEFDLEKPDELDAPDEIGQPNPIDEPASGPIEDDADGEEPDLEDFDFDFEFDLSELKESPRPDESPPPDFDEELPEKVEPEIITPEIELDLAEWDIEPPEQIELQAIEVEDEPADEDFVLPGPEEEPESKTAGREPGR